MTLLAQIAGWISIACGAWMLVVWMSGDDAGLLLAPSLIIGGVLIAVLGEIAFNVSEMRDELRKLRNAAGPAQVAKDS